MQPLHATRSAAKKRMQPLQPPRGAHMYACNIQLARPVLRGVVCYTVRPRWARRAHQLLETRPAWITTRARAAGTTAAVGTGVVAVAAGVAAINQRASTAPSARTRAHTRTICKWVSTVAPLPRLIPARATHKARRRGTRRDAAALAKLRAVCRVRLARA